MAITQKDIDWLKNDLANTNNPTVIFSHVPLDNVSEERQKREQENANDNNTDENSIDLASRFGYPKKGGTIRRILEKSNKVILAMSGHIHANRYREINGIHYITQQSLTSTYQQHYLVPSSTFSFLDLSDGKITVRLKGKASITIDNKLQKTYKLTPKQTL